MWSLGDIFSVSKASGSMPATWVLGSAIFSVTYLKDSSRPDTSLQLQVSKQLLKSLRDKKRKGRRNEVSSLERSPGLELSHGGQGQLQQLSQGGVAGVCVALGQESRQSGIGTNAWLPVLLKQLGHLYLLQLLKVAGTDGSQELVT